VLGLEEDVFEITCRQRWLKSRYSRRRLRPTPEILL
jgi:hypothetical protein